MLKGGEKSERGKVSFTEGTCVGFFPQIWQTISEMGRILIQKNKKESVLILSQCIFFWRR